MRPITFEQAKARYVHRYTVEHVPQWSQRPCGNGKYYAPQFATDREWFDKALFPGEGHVSKRDKHCYSTGQSWPKGQWLDAPFKRA